ncbi:hypothetical protein GUJ93_ZPchr0006g42194 [Zizania palustris]|uniref:WRKY domain-containing protein n=1 Tax=Zizania palustris TaxID=103762 RepID=A0A8J5TB43_ZIZPA|nr:hypothetical protein GUJ93_ZPchr0006g42194 [Zizania palustris]
MGEELCGNNWDLGAVVRLGCCRSRVSPSLAQQQQDSFAAFLAPPPQQQLLFGVPEAVKEELGVVDGGWSFPDLAAGDGAGELLRAFCAAFPSRKQSLPQTPPVTAQKQQQANEQPPQRPELLPENLPVQTTAATPARPKPATRQVAGGVPRSKKRKNQQKKAVRHVPADGVSADVWAWRKYGQKPIKGSPYPRGYYRCSSSKGCPARKQVERSRSDPNTFILTYTGEHNHSAPTHRNSLAGTTRNKLPSSSSAPPQPPPPSMVVASSEAHGQSPPSTSAGLSPTTPLRTPSMEEDEEEDDELLVEDMEMAGEDELLFLNGGDDTVAALDDGISATPIHSLFDIDEPFLGSPWTVTEEPTTRSTAAGAGS